MSADRTVSNGRLPDGRFGPGNKMSPGNPNARRMYEFRQRLLSAISPEAIEAVAKSLSDRATAGDLDAIKVLLDYCVGKPPAAIELSGPEGEPLGGLDWPKVQGAILEALAPFGEARIAVAVKLRELRQDERPRQPDSIARPGGDDARAGDDA